MGFFLGFLALAFMVTFFWTIDCIINKKNKIYLAGALSSVLFAVIIFFSVLYSAG